MDTLAPLKIKIIIGSTRPGRFSEKPAHWIKDVAAMRDGLQVDLLDLRDYPLPFFDEAPQALRTGEYVNPVATRWAQQVREGDGYIIVSPEYNHGYPAVLKNALDYVYTAWNSKPVGFVSYGGVAGARGVQQLRQVAIELQMAPIRNAIHLPLDVYLAAMKEPTPVNPEVFKPSRAAADAFLDQLVWWAKALKAARLAEMTQP